MSQASDPEEHPLVEALRRKTSHQDERIEELEKTVEDLEGTIELLRIQLEEVKE